MAVITTVVALLPIVIGALVTSMKAGMAFRDWPSSDGHFMLSYPWLGDLLRGAMDKFVEHGHRLAGVLIGCTSLVLVIVFWRRENRRWVRCLALGVLLGVFLQGLLGGARVLADDPRMAMIHGNFAAFVFCLMGTLALVTGRSWMNPDCSEASHPPIAGDVDEGNARRKSESKEPVAAVGICGNDLQDSIPAPLLSDLALLKLKILSVMTVLVVYGQYLLGGQQRHLHTLLHEHLAGALATLVFTLVLAVCVWRTGLRFLRLPALWLVFLLTAQLVLGAGSWITKFGFPPTGYVAVPGTPLQLCIRSAHTVTGMLLLLSAVTLAIRIFRFSAFRAGTHEHRDSASTLLSRQEILSAAGGAR